MITTEKTVLIEAENLNLLRMYESVNNSIVLLDPLSGQWYSVPTECARRVDAWNDNGGSPWTRADIATLEVCGLTWEDDRREREIYLQSPYDCMAVLIQTDTVKFAITNTIHDKLFKKFWEIEGSRPQETLIKIVLSDPVLIDADGYHEDSDRCEDERGPIVLYRAAEVVIEPIDMEIPF